MATSTGGGSCASLIGRTLGGYEVLALIGRGAMGTVYLAEDKALQRYVALKVLLGNLARNPSLVKSLQLEAKAAAPLQHPNIVRIFSAGMEHGTPYMAMEYVEGEPLDRFLKRNGRLHWTTAFYIGLQVAEALRYTHSRGVIHRDVKPANVLLDRHGRARLTDFGIANIQAEEGDLAEASGFLGTPHYMSPEQCEGKGVSASSDLYSLGVSLFQMLTGELPFTADSPMALVKAIATEPAPRISKRFSEVPDDVSRLVAHLLEKRPEDRPRSAEEVCKSMTRLQKEGGGKSAMPSALNAFIREQAQIRTLPVVAQREAAKRAPRSFKGRLKRALMGSPARTAGALLLSVLCASVPVLTWTQGLVEGSAMSAPVLREMSFDKQTGEFRTARLPVEGFRADEVLWIGSRHMALARVRGIDGGLTQGARGLFTVDPQAQRAWSVRPPSGAVLEAEPPRISLFGGWSHALSAVPSGATLQDAFLAQDLHPLEGYADLVAQKAGEAAPRATVLYRTRVIDATGQSAIRQAVASPDGHTVCLLLFDPEETAEFLVTRDTRWLEPERVGPRLSPSEGRVMPESIQFAPGGAYLVYAVETAPENRELWTVPADGRVENATKLFQGDFMPCVAVSPDGRRIAVATGGGDKLLLLDAASGLEEATLGPGLIGMQSWHPSGTYLLAMSEDDTGTTYSPWAIETVAPYRRVPVQSPAEMTGVCAVSRDGAWAAAIAEGTPDLTTVFMRLGSVRFDG